MFWNYWHVAFGHYIKSNVTPENNNECSPLLSNISLLARDVT